MMKKNALRRIGISSVIKLALVASLIIFSTASCSDLNPSNTGSILEDPIIDGSDSHQLLEGNSPVLQVYSEMGESGMRVTYSPMSLLDFTNVEQLEGVYAELMACVGLSAATPPSILLSSDETLFHVREDGADIQGFYDTDTSLVTVYSDDIDENLGNQFWWTRHGMIEYLINVHNLTPDSAISPFLNCHWANN